jgi:hypothetical protein
VPRIVTVHVIADVFEAPLKGAHHAVVIAFVMRMFARMHE